MNSDKHSYPSDGDYTDIARSALWMLCLNALLSLSKGAVGWFGGSFALLADGVNNLTDVGLSLGLYLAMRLAGRPPDLRHPYGHGKIEPEIARLVGIVILITAGVLAASSWSRFPMDHPPPDLPVMAVAALAMGVKEGMYRVQRRLARRLGSIALEADALNHRTDVGATLAVLLGTAAIYVGGERWAFCDDLAALIVSGLMGFNAAQVIWLASREMLDEMPPLEIIDAVRHAALSLRDEGVLGVEKALGRKMGLRYLLDLHLEVASEMSVRDAHYLGHRVRDTIVAEVPQVMDVLIHLEPHGREEERRNAP